MLSTQNRSKGLSLLLDPVNNDISSVMSCSVAPPLEVYGFFSWGFLKYECWCMVMLSYFLACDWFSYSSEGRAPRLAQLWQLRGYHSIIPRLRLQPRRPERIEHSSRGPGKSWHAWCWQLLSILDINMVSAFLPSRSRPGSTLKLFGKIESRGEVVNSNKKCSTSSLEKQHWLWKS